jgi:hypothetical protein
MNYFESIWGDDIGKGDDPYAFVVSKMVENQIRLSDTLDQAIGYFCRMQCHLESLEALSVLDKVVVLRKLFVNNLPNVAGHARNYLFRFNEDLERIEQVQTLSQKILLKFLLHRNETWLYELVDLADWICAADFYFEESMVCEHEDFQENKD